MKPGLNSDPEGSRRDFGLAKTKILRGQKNIQRLFENDAFIIRAKKVNLRFLLFKDVDEGCRMAFIVSKRLGNAVHRNRVKRLLREAFRLHQHLLSDLMEEHRIGFHGALMSTTLTIDYQQAEQAVRNLLSNVSAYIPSFIDSDI